MLISILLASTVAIIGGGPSGIVAAKEAKACGLDPVLFEKGSSIGGVWRPDEGKIWESLKINNSRYSSCFSDFPWDENIDFFPNAKEVYNYLCSYAKHFQILDCAKLKCDVTQIKQVEDKWVVEWIQDKQSKETAVFDSVIICSGLFSKAYTPQIPGLEEFQGSYIHSEKYRNPSLFAGKKVAVIGNSFSGTEIAADVAQKADVVYHIFQRPYWLLSRYRKAKNSSRTLPFDLISFKRSTSFLDETDEQRNERINTILYELCNKQFKVHPDLAISRAHTDYPFITTSDVYLRCVKNGTVIPKIAQIQKIDKDALYLLDGSTLSVDEIIFSTGYSTEVPFFNADMQKKLEFESDHAFQPFILHNIFHDQFPNLAFIGMARYTIFFGIIEMQARLACLTLSKKIDAPSRDAIQEGMKISRKMRMNKIKSQNCYNNHVAVCENLANQIGVLPNFSHVQTENPDLYDKLINGPFTTASYRLFGFGNNQEIALKMIDDINKQAGDPLGPCELYFDE